MGDVQKICVLNYLAEMKHLSETLSEIDEQIEKQTSKLEGLSLSYSGMPGSPNANTDKLSNGVALLIELREGWDAAYYSYARELEHARLLCLPIYPERYLLWLHFVEGLTWRKVGEKVGYSPDHAQKLSHKGYEQLYQLMPERFRRLPKAL